MSSNRSIFEDVDENSSAAKKIHAGIIDRGRDAGARAGIRYWLVGLFTLVVIMIVVGGLTRLTDSGLSITEWRPITGAMPPLSANAWDLEFQKYKEIPEYQIQNFGMTLSEFKVIYWWEWGHRQLGRIIGLVWALGFVFFFLRKAIPVGWTNRLLLLGILGGLQGAVGWWMVASGLHGDRLDVASYRLATHLGIAFIIVGYITWFIQLLNKPEHDLIRLKRSRDSGLFRSTSILLYFGYIQILLGALVAGIDAGRAYTDWPLMAGQFFPPEPFSLYPLWRNFFEDYGLVQFLHRTSGYVLFSLGMFIWWRSKRSGNVFIRSAFNFVIAVLWLQIFLGIITVLYGAPWYFAIVHQFGAILMWVAILRARFMSGYPPQNQIRS